MKIHGYHVDKNSDGTFSILTENGIVIRKSFDAAISYILVVLKQLHRTDKGSGLNSL